MDTISSEKYATADITPSVGPIEDQPLRILALDTQGICSQLFSKQLCTHLNFGSITHPYLLAATMGRDRIHNKLQCDEGTRRLWDERAAQAPPKIANMTYNVATEKFLREADRLESKVCVVTIFVDDCLTICVAGQNIVREGICRLHHETRYHDSSNPKPRNVHFQTHQSNSTSRRTSPNNHSHHLHPTSCRRSPIMAPSSKQ